MIRNLLYNCCPLSWSDEWRANVAKLNSYADAFNGRRIVIVRTGDGCTPPPEVEQAFDLGPVEFVHLPNDPELGELPGFVEQLARLQSLREDEATFYAHTKGVSYTAPERRLEAIRRWRDAMYDGCLSDVERVEHALQSHACAGCFLQQRRNVSAALLRVASLHGFDWDWHFAGTFYWLKHSALFSLPDWHEIKPTKYGPEAFPGRHFTVDQAFALNDLPPHGFYTNLSRYVCEGCGHSFEHRERKMRAPLLKICPSCHKRRGQFAEYLGP